MVISEIVFNYYVDGTNDKIKLLKHKDVIFKSTVMKKSKKGMSKETPFLKTKNPF